MNRRLQRSALLLTIAIASLFFIFNRSSDKTVDEKIPLPIPQKQGFEIDGDYIVIRDVDANEKLYIDSTNLEMHIRRENGRNISISSPVEDIDISQLGNENGGISFYIPKYDIKTSVVFADRRVSVDFETSKVGKFSWPRIDHKRDGYVAAPFYLGYRIPLSDSKWEDYLLEKSPINTMESLSMPFWSIRKDEATISYIMKNPYDNELYFSKSGGEVSMKFTHSYNRIWKKRTYGFDIFIDDENDPTLGAKRYRKRLIEEGSFVSIKEKIKRTGAVEKLLGAGYLMLTDDYSVEDAAGFVRFARDNKIDRIWIGSDNWDSKDRRNMFELFSYNGILTGVIEGYSRVQKDEERDLYENAAILDKQGQFLEDFRGRLLNPIISMDYMKDYMEKLVGNKEVSSVFMDEEERGLLYDDYSKLHRMNKEEDLIAKIEKTDWIKDRFKVIIGSNNQKYYAPRIDDFVMFQIDEDEGYQKLFESYRYKLPLYQTVFNDSVMITRHFNSKDLSREEILDSILFNNPTVIDLDSKLLGDSDFKTLVDFYKEFSKLNKKLSLLYMKEYKVLDANNAVKLVNYQNDIILIANYSSRDYYHRGKKVPAKSIWIRNLEEGYEYIYP